MSTRTRIRDSHISGVRPLVTPARVRSRLPLGAKHRHTVLGARQAAARVLAGDDDRLLVIVGPCSVHDRVAALDYARRLGPLATELSGELLVVMRVYFEKPRSSHGWRGLVNDPHLDGSYAVNDGVLAARELLLEILDQGVAVACEFLDPIMPQYIADAVSWGAIGARTTHSQVHRQLASGLSMPVGFKNSTEGDVQGAVDAVAVAARSQVFPGVTYGGRGAVFSTSGNPDCHVVLRGTTKGPNYDEASVADAVARLVRLGLPPHVLIDASHGNSGKDHRRQPVVAREVARRIAGGDRGIVGLMLESFLVEGRQELELGHASKLVYGQSITDACIGWDTTVEVLHVLAGAARARRSGGSVTEWVPSPGDPEARIAQLRSRVDEIDAGIVRLLAERAAAVSDIATAKGHRAVNIRDLDRERVVFDQVEAAAALVDAPRDFVRSVFETIVAGSIDLQRPRPGSDGTGLVVTDRDASHTSGATNSGSGGGDP